MIAANQVTRDLSGKLTREKWDQWKSDELQKSANYTIVEVASALDLIRS